MANANEKALTPVQKTVSFLMSETVKAGIAKSCSRHVTPDRLLRVAAAAVSRQPKLAECTPASLYLALSNCGQLGLEPNLLGAAHLVPYRNKNGTMEAQFIPGYRGLIEMARRSGAIQTLSAHIVHEKDVFSYVVGDRPHHEPYLGSDDPGPMRIAWAIAHFKDGGFQVEVMTRRDIDAIRSRSKAKDSGPWVTDYDEMAKKTVVRRLCKYLPLTIELADAVAADTAFEIGDAIDVPHTVIEDKPAETATDRLAGKLKAAREKNGKPTEGPEVGPGRARWEAAAMMEPGMAKDVLGDLAPADDAEWMALAETLEARIDAKNAEA